MLLCLGGLYIWLRSMDGVCKEGGVYGRGQWGSDGYLWVHWGHVFWVMYFGRCLGALYWMCLIGDNCEGCMDVLYGWRL